MRMKPLSVKRFLQLEGPTEEDSRGDRERILEALKGEFPALRFSLAALRQLYPLCREAGWAVTVTIACLDGAQEILRVEKGDTTNTHYGAAIDLGSTTVVMELVRLTDGETCVKESLFNGQIAYGEEILSRIFYTKDNAEHLAELQAVTAKTIQQLLDDGAEKAGISTTDISAVTVGGNTTMTHLFAGLFPWPIFETPYAPAALAPGFIRGDELGLSVGGYVYLMPSAANYLGGDIISGLLAADMDREERLSVFIDIGTNGELVVGNGEFLLAGAGAAGPALEGGISKSGMRAAPGAVERVKIENGELSVSVIGEEKPRGICGSGIVELLAEMLLNGWIDFRGNFREEASPRIIWVDGVHEEEENAEKQLAVCYAWKEESADGEELVFTQQDVREFIRTKSAAHTMVAVLLEQFGLPLDEVEQFYLAGAFGTYLDLEAAVTIGLYPDLPREKFVCLGNASLAGAKKLLLDQSALSRIAEIREKITYVQFGAAADFIEKMRMAQFLPHTDLDSYPTVKERLREHGRLE